MSIKCKRDGKLSDVTWLFLKNAWVSAITVCYERLYPEAKPTPYAGSCYVYIDENYVDYRTFEELGGESGASHEANTVIAGLKSNNFRVKTFSGVSYSDWGSVISKLGASGYLLIPELEENDNLYQDLDGDTIDAFLNWINNGGNLVMFAPSETLNFLNSMFGFNLDSTSITEPITVTESGSAAINGLTSTLESLDATNSLDASTLPENSVTIYVGDNLNESVVTQIPYGDGKIYVLGYDWYSAAPIGDQDGNWINLLVKIVGKN